MTGVEGLVSCSFCFVSCFAFAVCSGLLFSHPSSLSSLFAFCCNLCFQVFVYVLVCNRCLTWLSDHHGWVVSPTHCDV